MKHPLVLMAAMWMVVALAVCVGLYLDTEPGNAPSMIDDLNPLPPPITITPGVTAGGHARPTREQPAMQKCHGSVLYF